MPRTHACSTLCSRAHLARRSRAHAPLEESADEECKRGRDGDVQEPDVLQMCHRRLKGGLDGRWHRDLERDAAPGPCSRHPTLLKHSNTNFQ